MTSTDATQAVKALWWLVLIRGVLAVLFGLYALFSPAGALLALVFVFGFYAIMDGVAAIAVGFRHRRTSHWGWHVVQGVVSLIAGDRPGLLSRIARVLTLYDINLHTAKINTLGARAEDVFLVSGPALYDAKTVVRFEAELIEQLRT